MPADDAWALLQPSLAMSHAGDDRSLPVLRAVHARLRDAADARGSLLIPMSVQDEPIYGMLQAV